MSSCSVSIVVTEKEEDYNLLSQTLFCSIKKIIWICPFLYHCIHAYGGLWTETNLYSFISVQAQLSLGLCL